MSIKVKIAFLLVATTTTLQVQAGFSKWLGVKRDVREARVETMSLRELGFNSDAGLQLSDEVMFLADASDVSTAPHPFTSLTSDSIKAKFKRIRDNRIFVTAMEGKEIKLPFGISKTIGDKEYIIGIDKIYITPEGTFADVFTVIPDKKNGGELVFLGEGIGMNSSGGFSGPGEIKLMSNYSFNIGKSTITLVKDSTYVRFDCNGFKEIHACINAKILSGEIEGVDNNGKSTGDVTVRTTAEFEDIDNWMIENITIPKFQFKAYPGFTFQVQKFGYDHHSTKNIPNMVFPQGYKLGKGNDWEGFRVDTVSIEFPEEFTNMMNQRAAPGTKMTVMLYQALIDELGFTGGVSVDNLLDIGAGKADGWQFSVDYFAMKFMTGTVDEFGFRGQAVVPITSDTYKFAYEAKIQSKDPKYYFMVTIPKTVEFNIWAANVQLYPDSKLQITCGKSGDKTVFKPVAVLSGKLSIGASIGGKEGNSDDGDDNAKVALAELRFAGLTIKTEKSFVSLDKENGELSLGSPALEQKFAKLPLTISEIEFKEEGEKAGIKFKVNLNLAGSEGQGSGFGAEGTFTVWGKDKSTDKNGREWGFAGITPDKFAINNVRVAVLTLNGSVEFFRDDNPYGSGFTGKIGMTLELSESSKIGADIEAIFGKKKKSNSNDVFRYWGVDALASFNPISLYPGIIYLNGIGGGASNRMDISTTKNSSTNYTTFSGISYEPEESSGLSVRAMVLLQGARPEIYNGFVGLEIAFESNGSLKRIMFNGKVKFLAVAQALEKSVGPLKDKMGDAVSKMKKGGSSMDNPDDISKEEGIVCAWMMQYLATEKKFTLNSSVGVNVLGIITGGGTVAMEISDQQWFLYVGKPSSKMGLKLQIGPIMASSGNYFAMGNHLTDVPTIAGYTPSDLKGFAFGNDTRVEIRQGGLFFYHVGVGVAFDAIVENVKGKVCKESNKPFGINNWYCQGQFGVSFSVGAGIKVCIKLPSCKGFIKCKMVEKCATTEASLDLEPTLAFKTPNPTRVTHVINILGKKISINIGKNCSY